MSDITPPRLPTSAAPTAPDVPVPLEKAAVVQRPARPDPEPPPEDSERSQASLAGLITTGALHFLLIAAVIISSLGFTKKETKAQPRERIIETRIVQIQAGSAEGTRTKGPAYKRPDNARKRRARRRSKRYRVGPSRHRLPKGAMITRHNTPTPPDDKDDATNAPADWGSQTGVMAPPGAKPSDDRKGAGGTAEKGALDPCFSQHAAVVASYKTIIRGKIPRFKRPAFVSADVARNLTTVVRVHIGGAGNILRASTARSSGNPRYDGAAVSHVKSIGKFPAPHRCVMYDKRRTRFRTSISVAVVIKSR